MKRKLLTILTASLLAVPMAVQAQAYDYEEIVYPGAPSTTVFGINNQGDAVGNGLIDTDSFPFVYSVRKGTLTNVTPIAGFSSTTILGISELGDKVGSVVSLDGTKQSGLFLSRNGTYTVFDHPDAPTSTQARAVNNRGLVTGFRDNVIGDAVGFIYDSNNGTFTDIVPSRFTIPQGINSSGEVVGSAIFDVANDPCAGFLNPFRRYGWLRAKDGTVTYFSVNNGRTNARGITDSGTIAGYVTTLGISKGFVVTLDGSQCQSITVADADLLVFPGAVTTIPHGITNSGEIAGSFGVASGVVGGFIATPQ